MKMSIEIVVIAHNIRSAHNVGALLRTCEGIGVKTLYFSGYTPYPSHKDDNRLPHIARKLNTQIQKTALGAENTQVWEYVENIESILNTLSIKGYEIVALEQSSSSKPLQSYNPPKKVAILIGSEVNGVDPSLLGKVSIHLEIPMFGKKESFNVVEATSMALFHLRFAR